MLSGLKFDTFLGYTITRLAAEKIIDLCQYQRINSVVELGSGTSTLIFNRLAKAGVIQQLTTIEHDPNYWQVTEVQLLEEEKSSRTTLLYRPLVDHWYGLQSDDIAPGIDLLLVDGPPGNLGPRSRQPAMQHLYPYLSPGAYVLLDDYYRQEEKDVLQYWLDHYDLHLETVWSVGLVSAIALCRR